MMDYSRKVTNSFLVFHYYALLLVITIHLYQLTVFPFIAPVSVALLEQLLTMLLRIKKYYLTKNTLYLNLLVENVLNVLFGVALVSNVYLKISYYSYLAVIFVI